MLDIVHVPMYHSQCQEDNPRRDNLRQTTNHTGGQNNDKRTDHQTRDECKVFDGKRIKADAMIERLNTERAELLKEAYELEYTLETLDKTLEQISSLKHAVNHIISGLPYTIRDTYGIKAC